MSTLAVRLGRAEYGLPAASVRHVLRPPPVTRTPFPPPDVQGVVQVRGALLTVLDLGTRLRGAPAALPGRLVVVAGPAGESVGLLVDGVVGLMDEGPEAAGAATAEAEASLPPGWLVGVAEPVPGRRVALLDLQRVLSGERE